MGLKWLRSFLQTVVIRKASFLQLAQYRSKMIYTFMQPCFPSEPALFFIQCALFYRVPTRVCTISALQVVQGATLCPAYQQVLLRQSNLSTRPPLGQRRVAVVEAESEAAKDSLWGGRDVILPLFFSFCQKYISIKQKQKLDSNRDQQHLLRAKVTYKVI